MKLANAPDVLTVEQAADVLGVSRGTAYEAARTGELPVLRIGRRLLVPRARLESLLGGDGKAAARAVRNSAYRRTADQ